MYYQSTTRLAGNTQVLTVAITAAANAAPVTIATVTTKACIIKSIAVKSNAATTADLTSFNVKGGASSVVTFIDDVTGLRANVAAADQQVAWTGEVYLPAAATITFDPTGTGATALDMTAVIEYVAAENTGYLA